MENPQKTPDSRTKLVSMKRAYYETGIVVMQSIAQALVRVMLEKERCRIVVEYDPAQDILRVFKELLESP